MTREQNIVATWYAIFAAISGGFLFHRWAAFWFIGFALAFTLKVVNSALKVNQPVELNTEIRMNEHSAPLVAAGTQGMELDGRANDAAR